MIPISAALENAREQAGVITRAQARECGMSPAAIKWQLRSGRWHRAFESPSTGKRPAVYTTTSGVLSRTAKLWAAILVCGKGAVLSHHSAAELDGLLDPPRNGRSDVHVTVPSNRTVQAAPGIVLHYSSRLAEARHPVKQPPRTRIDDTVVDLTQTATTLDQATSIVAQAVQKRLTTPDRIVIRIDGRAKVRWRRELLESCGVIRSGAESLLEARYSRKVELSHGLPIADRQVRLKADERGYIVDNRYRQYRLRVELDGQKGHTGDGVFRDMWRDNAAVLDGEHQLRFGWDDVDQRRCQTAAIVAAVLIRNGWDARPVPCDPDCDVRETLDGLLRRRVA